MNHPTEELFHLPITRYRDPEGHPTCAINFNEQKVCQFYLNKNFGTVETCFFLDFSSKHPDTLQRRMSADGKPDVGYLIPADNCPIWNKQL